MSTYKKLASIFDTLEQAKDYAAMLNALPTPEWILVGDDGYIQYVTSKPQHGEHWVKVYTNAGAVIVERGDKVSVVYDSAHSVRATGAWHVVNSQGDPKISMKRLNPENNKEFEKYLSKFFEKYFVDSIFTS